MCYSESLCSFSCKAILVPAGSCMWNKSLVFKSQGELSALLSVTKLDELELLLHGLDLGYLADIMTVSTNRMLE